MSEIERLLGIMARLRDPHSGCPWDVQQSFASIAPYTIEEAYEVADAIAREDLGDLCDELGDLLLQVVFHARMAEEIGAFDFAAVARAINEKMIRRHPHVFAGQQEQSDEALHRQWEALKAQERAEKSATGDLASALDGVTLGLPALTRAEKIQKRAARVGFDWPDSEPVFAKLDEEVQELREAQSRADAQSIEDEMGDCLFAAVNLARHLKVDPETALRKATLKFTRRFQQVEALAADNGKELTDMPADELERLWNTVKAAES